MRKSAAFTLAEVLITLGIIGVVAAMTIPTLISNMKGARIRAQFKKGISTLNQAARLNLANHDWDFGAIENSIMSMDSLLNANLTGLTKLYTYGSFKNPDYNINGLGDDLFTVNIGSGGWFNLYQLSDGMLFGMYSYLTGCSKDNYLTGNPYEGSNTGTYCVGFIDINGKQLPNKVIECSDPSKTKAIWENDYEECTVKITGDTGDVFPILFYDSTVVPSTNAGRYILNTAK